MRTRKITAFIISFAVIAQTFAVSASASALRGGWIALIGRDSVTVATDEKKGGKYSFKADLTGSKTKSARIYKEYEVGKNTYYRFSAWIKVTGGKNSGGGAYLFAYTDTADLNISPSVSSEEWQKSETVFYSGENTAVYIYLACDAFGSKTYFSGMKLVELTGKEAAEKEKWEGWEAAGDINAKITRVMDEKKNGDYSFKLDLSQCKQGGVAGLKRRYGVKKDAAYRFTVWAKTDGAESDGSADIRIGDERSVPINSKVWKKIELIFYNESESAVYPFIRAVSAETVYFSGMRLVKLSGETAENVKREKLGRQKELETAVKNILKIIKPGMSDFEKVTALHDWITDNVTYAYTPDGIADTSKYTARHALVGKSAICEGYALGFKLLLDKAGVENKIVFGYSTGGKPAGHAWNLVKIDGKWYHADATYDSGADNKYRYFLLSDKAMSADREWIAEDYPAAPKTYR